MSIFGPKDADVHLLTHFYQLEFDPEEPIGSELDQWLLLRMYGFSPHEDMVSVAKENGRELLASHHRRGHEVERVAPLKGMVHRLMDFMADGVRPRYGYGDVTTATEDDPGLAFGQSVSELNERSQALKPVLVIESPYNLENEPDKPLGLFYGDSGDNPLFDTVLLASLMETLPKGRSVFRRCPTCESVFIVGRAHQQRCSRRCNDREASRRRNEKKREEPIVTALHVLI